MSLDEAYLDLTDYILNHRYLINEENRTFPKDVL
jgi:DNA polymerase kappa